MREVKDIYEYQQKYVKRENVKKSRLCLKLIAGLIGLIIFTCLVSLSLEFYKINQYAGYVASGVSLIIFIIAYIIPLIKISSLEAFQVNINTKHAKKAKVHNKKLRKKLANQIIDLASNIDNVKYYDEKQVAKLEKAMKENNEEDIKYCLNKLYSGSIKKTAQGMIYKTSLKVGSLTALSQEQKLDVAVVVALNLQLAKDIIFLYGYRPSETKMINIFCNIVNNSLIAYSLANINVGSTIVKSISSVSKALPIIGSALSTVVDSSIQGLSNGALTLILGHKTIEYLSKEYQLANILENVDVYETEEELSYSIKNLKEDLGKFNKVKA